MATSSAVEKTAEQLQKEIDELHRQQREITERIKDPRGLRRAGAGAGAGAGAVAGGGGGGRFGANGAPRGRGFVRTADRSDSRDEPAPKRRLSSAVVKVKDGEVVEKAGVVVNGEEDLPVGGASKENVNDIKSSDSNENRLVWQERW